jgi:hypothetical protein
MASDFDSALKIAQALIHDEMDDAPLTVEMIAEQVDAAIAMRPRWKETVDRSALIRELETRFSVWIGRETFLSNDDDHVAWLNAERKENWRYWPRYRQWREEQWSPRAVDALDQVTDRVVGLLEDPNRPGAWDRRGLVVGHVQSGKTANYTGIICKAADAGYKLIIVLAGLHKNLRSQTQMRLDEGFLGYETMPMAQALGRELRTIGVGHIDSDPSIRPDYVTNRSDDGDFKKTVANNMGIAPGHRPWLFVIKKNPSVLRNLISWVEERVANTHDAASGRPMVKDLPLLVIDDEADNASVDTGEQGFDETGRPDPDYEPKTINRLIRRLLFIFEKSAYVGYTATPFANIFIHEGARTGDHGEDLFPRSFIVNLPAPSNYAGPVRIFGLEPSGDEIDGSPSLPLTRSIEDHAASLSLNEREGWMPPKHRNGHRPLYHGQDVLPPSLQDAILSFLIVCAVRRARGHVAAHNSMLIHVTKFTSVQGAVTRQVREFLDHVRMRLRRSTADAELLDDLGRLWNNDFVPTTDVVAKLADSEELSLPEWEIIRELLPLVVSDIHIREINGYAGDILDYETHRTTGLNVIAIGGDKLARGLTLEGLSISYFLRAAKMYDTLMQMGRWFGYRPGYLDLCRLYTTPDLEEWFQHITEASEELRLEFDHMAAVGGTPRDYGLKVKSHPVLMVTSRVKMRNSEELQLSFAGEVQETVVFHREQPLANISATQVLLKKLGKPLEDPNRPRPEGAVHKWIGSRLWEKVPGALIVEFLSSFKTHETALKVNSLMIAEFIKKQQSVGELNFWTVALLAGDGPEKVIGDVHVNSVKRRINERSYPLAKQIEQGRYLIRRLLAPRDEAIDLDNDAYKAAMDLTLNAWQSSGRTAATTQPSSPSGPSIRRIRGLGDPAHGVSPHPERGLLLLYPLAPFEGGGGSTDPIIGFGISFPESRKAQSVTYKVNNVYWAQEFGGEA